jgi:energy-coupling factor transporter transmembrane protein EcfT
MNLVLVWIWWFVVIATLLTLIVLWLKKIVDGSVAGLLLMLLIILVIIGIIWFSYWGDVNDSTVKPGHIVWYTSNETRTQERDTSVTTLRLTNADNNTQIGTVNIGVIDQGVSISNVSITTTAGSRYVVRIENKSTMPVNISISSSTLTFTGPSKTAPF